MATRMLCLWCPDWPVAAARRSAPALEGVPVAVLDRGVVLSASPEARAEGVRRGLRRREAEACCPGLVGLAAEPAAEARAFEALSQAVEAIAPRLALERPGLLFVPTRGPSRYFGGDDALASRILAEAVGAGVAGCRAGVADGAFAARLAARQAEAGKAFVVPPGATPGFLASWPVRVLEDAALADLLVRLGLPTLGDFAGLPPASVLGRFGPAGLAAHRRARGLEDRQPVLRAPPPELTVAYEFDPPATRVETAVFAGRALAEELTASLAGNGLACTRVRVEADTEHGERLARCWRLGDGNLGPPVMAERIRGQLEAWVSRGEGVDDDTVTVTGGLTLLRLVPEEVVEAGRSQLGLWGGDRVAAERAARALVRLQSQLGPEAVTTPVLTGGRTPDERVSWVPWGESSDSCDGKGHIAPLSVAGSSGRAVGPAAAPWPGAVPPPAPALVFRPGRPAELLDTAGTPVTVSARGEASAPPGRLHSPVLPRGGGPVEAWAGPWLHDLRWWDPPNRRRRALWQVVVGGVACLVATEGGEARLEAIYD